MRGFEIGPVIYERVCDRLGAALLAVADVQAADAELDHAHLALTAAILDGDAAAAARLARSMARSELRSLEVTLG